MKNDISSSSHAVAGLLAGTTSVMCVQPLDTLKTLLQQQNPLPLRSLISKPLLLWRGTFPTLLRTVPGSSLYFVILDRIQSPLSQFLPPSISNPVSGGLARGFVGFLLMPLTVLKVRIESSVYSYNDILSATKSILKQQGIRGLFSGTTATMLRDIPFASLYLLVYRSLKPIDASFQSTLAVASISAISATLVTHPFDMIKTRIQLTPFPLTSTAALTLIWQEGGIKSLLRGVGLRVLRKGLSSGITWAVYEEVLKLTKKV